MKRIPVFFISLLLAMLMGLLPLFPAEASVFVVNSVDDVNDGSCNGTHCSLREAILAAESNAGPDEVRFSISGCGGVCTIQPLTPLPTLANGGTTITGYTMAGATYPTETTAANLVIRVDGALVPSTADNGFSITSSGNTIKGLIITRFSFYGIAIGGGATDNVISGNIIGTDGADTTGLGNGAGVGLADGAHNNTIGGDQYMYRNVISGNLFNGVDVQPFSGVVAYDNTISGNYIGTTNLGDGVLSNGATGVQLAFGTYGNMVGGSLQAERNVISGNMSDGVVVRRPLTNDNTLYGNYIGTSKTGMVSVPNGGNGVSIYDESDNNTIGGTGTYENNLISGNGANGVRIYGSGTTGNVVVGNIIGARLTGDLGLPNGNSGVLITESASNNTIGGTSYSDANQISGNLSSGVTISVGAFANTVKANFIGTNSNGYAAVQNLGAGVWIGSGATDNIIGDDYTNARNIISGNSSYGVLITGSATTGNSVAGNCIGTQYDAAAAIPNGSSGVSIESGAHSNTIGGETVAEQNVISGNTGNGVLINGAGTNDNSVLGNRIGSRVDGILAVPNQGHGVQIMLGAAHNTIGPGNQISGNDLDGVYITDSAANNEVVGNLIGPHDNGMASMPNRSGVVLDADATNNVIGGETSADRNVISGNDENGVLISDTGTTGNRVIGNYIGLSSSGSGLTQNEYGVVITAGAQSNVVGEPGARNVISGNLYDGVVLSGDSTSDNTIASNYIGTDASGSAEVGNQQSGVHIHSGATGNWIGGTNSSHGNLISGNYHYGVLIEGAGTDGNILAANIIGLDAAGTSELQNGDHGVAMMLGAENNLVGGDAFGERNLISGNFGFGVLIRGAGTDGNVVSANYIGIDQTGMVAIDNDLGGILIDDGAQHNMVGGDVPGERNVISGNNGPGVEMTTSGTANNTVSGNYIGVDSTGMGDLGNTTYGVLIRLNAGSNVIGGPGSEEGNVISGNQNAGVSIDSSSGNEVVGNIIGLGKDGSSPMGNNNDGVRIQNSSSGNIIGPGNRIAHNAFHGVSVDGVASTGNVITQNQIFDNGYLYEIRLVSGANAGMTPAYISSVTGFPITISGTACAGCTAEVFANPIDDEAGRIYLGNALADGSGDWSLVVGAIPAPYLTATATDATDGTSMFSNTYLSDILSLFLPLIMR